MVRILLPLLKTRVFAHCKDPHLRSDDRYGLTTAYWVFFTIFFIATMLVLAVSIFNIIANILSSFIRRSDIKSEWMPPIILFQVRTYTLGALRYDHKILWSAGGWSSHCGICFVDNCDKNSAPQGCCSSARWRRPLPRTTTRRSRTSSLLAWVGSVRSFAQSFHDNYDHGRDDWDDWSIMGGRLDWGSSWRRRSTILATWSTSGSCSYKVHHNSYHESWS